MRLDLHLHTIASDGQHTPAHIVQMARARKLDVIAITDHDTLDGIAPAQAEAARPDAGRAIRVLAGIELSAEDDAGDVHMLGYCFDTQSALLRAKLDEFRERRYTRGQDILDKLAEMGLPLAWERVLAYARQGNEDAGARPASIGRPHIARAMVDAGYVDTVRTAFERYLHNGGPAYVSRARLTPEDSIALIHAAGGVAVLAHPGLLAHPVNMVERLVPAGLDGIEVWHPKNYENTRLNARAQADRHDLIMTGGSDFHGADLSTVSMGSEAPPAGAVAALEARAARYRG